MDSIFGIGTPELIVILLLAGIVMGPQRIRQVALWLGRTTAYFQSISRNFARQLSAELDAVDGAGDIREALNEVQDLRRQIKELRNEMTTAAVTPIREGKEAIQETQELARQVIAPPSLRLNSDGSGGMDDPVREGKAPADPNPQQADVDGQAVQLSSAADNSSGKSEPTSLPKLLEVADDPD